MIDRAVPPQEYNSSMFVCEPNRPPEAIPGAFNVAELSAEQLALLYLGHLAVENPNSLTLLEEAGTTAQSTDMVGHGKNNGPLTSSEVKELAKNSLMAALGQLCTELPKRANTIARESAASPEMHKRLLAVLLYGGLHLPGQILASPDSPAQKGSVWQELVLDPNPEVSDSAQYTVNGVIEELTRAVTDGASSLQEYLFFINLAGHVKDDPAARIPRSLLA